MAKQVGEVQGENFLFRVRDTFCALHIRSAILYYLSLSTIELKRGFDLDFWPRGLSVMLEKKPGVTLIEKLRAILLMESDSNASYKEIFGNRMLSVVRIH